VGLLVLLAALLGTLATGASARAAKGAEREPSDPGASHKDASEPPILDTPYADERAGRKAAEEAARAIGVVDEPALTAYVQAIGGRLAAHAPGHRFTYRFRIADQAAPNAFALPGGFIFISRGALALTSSEDELANILGHEIAHVASRHAAARQQVTGGRFLAALELPWLAAYSRDLERSADRQGQEIAAAAGYDPAGLARFLDSLGALERLRLGAARETFFLDTHPGSRGRAAEAGQHAQMLQWRPQPGFSRTRAEHLRRLDGLALGDRASQGVFVGSRFLHPDLGFTIRFPDGWETRNTPAAVGAIARDGRAQVCLENGGDAESPARAAEQWAPQAQAEGVHIARGRQIRLLGQSAYQLEGSTHGAHLVVTFIRRGGRIYRIVGVSNTFDRHQALFMNVARSFRPLTPELRAQVRELRLRIVEARDGESLEALSTRSGNVWSPSETAVWNELASDRRLAAGQLIKVAVSEPYGSRGEAQKTEPPAGGRGQRAPEVAPPRPPGPGKAIEKLPGAGSFSL